MNPCDEVTGAFFVTSVDGSKWGRVKIEKQTQFKILMGEFINQNLHGVFKKTNPFQKRRGIARVGSKGKLF